MTEKEIETYCANNGIPTQRRTMGGVERFRVMDTTQLPMAMREACDERGFFTGSLETAGAMEEVELSPGPVDELPADFPGHAALDAAGLTTLTQVREIEDLTSIAGIGEATAEKITEALEAE